MMLTPSDSIPSLTGRPLRRVRLASVTRRGGGLTIRVGGLAAGPAATRARTALQTRNVTSPGPTAAGPRRAGVPTGTCTMGPGIQVH